MSQRKIKAARRAQRQAQATDSSAGYDGTTWGRILRTAGPALSAQLNDLLAQGDRFEDLGIVAGEGAVMSRLCRGWPAESPLAAVVTSLADLRAIAARLMLPDDMREQLAAPAPAGEVHVLIIETGRVDCLTQPVRRVDLKPLQAPIIDPDKVSTADLIALAKLEAARIGVSLTEADVAEMATFCRDHKAAILAGGARWAHGAARPGGQA